MKTAKIGTLIMLVPIFVGAVILSSNKTEPIPPEYASSVQISSTPVVFDLNQLNESFKQTPPSRQLTNVRGVILPHHVVASDMLAEVLLAIDTKNVKRIILLGPNHFETGVHAALSAEINWDLNGQIFTFDQATFEELAQQGLLASDNVNVINEHAITVPLPYLQRVMPDATILPIMLSENQSIERLTALGEQLTPDEETLIIASVDFSHYLSLDQATKNDELSGSLITAWDYTGLYALDSDYLDSSSAIIVFLTAMQTGGATEQVTIGHSNSALIQGIGHESTTSYFTRVFRQPNSR
jgi:AmmeMemoRadiSam system protein B